MVLLKGNMSLWVGYVWDVDSKKWDLWKAMRSYARRFLTWGREDGRFLGGPGWESGRPQSDGRHNQVRALLPRGVHPLEL